MVSSILRFFLFIDTDVILVSLKEGVLLSECLLVSTQFAIETRVMFDQTIVNSSRLKFYF